MRIALVVPPFITVPPERYGGTELFVAELAEGLRAHGHSPVVYTIGASRVDCETRWRRHEGHWPIDSALESNLEDLEHSSWACHDAARDSDVIHLNNAPGLNVARFIRQPMVYTLHHPHEASLSHYYSHFREVRFVAISHNQARAETMPQLSVIHHGLRLENYQVAEGKRDYLCFIGRIAPIKGVHTAIEVARRAGMPLKIAGEIQPVYQEYWQRLIRPQVDGRAIEYVGEVDLAAKNALLAGARALLFPIEWEEPFGLVMIEAMACGVPVLALPCGSAPEVVADGESGWICRDAAEMTQRVLQPPLTAARCRAFVERRFNRDEMVRKYLAVYEAQLARDVAASRRSVPASRVGIESLPLAS